MNMKTSTFFRNHFSNVIFWALHNTKFWSDNASETSRCVIAWYVNAERFLVLNFPPARYLPPRSQSTISHLWWKILLYNRRFCSWYMQSQPDREKVPENASSFDKLCYSNSCITRPCGFTSSIKVPIKSFPYVQKTSRNIILSVR